MYSAGTVSVFLLSVFLTTVSGQQKVVSVDTIQDGGSFMVYCDANRVTFPVSGVQDISILTLHRQTVGSQDYDMIAQYKTFGGIKEIQNVPVGRQWTVNFSGENGGSSNRNSMKIEMTVPDARCEDAGLYKCTVRYTNPSDFADAGVDSPEQNVTAQAGISELTLTLDPDTSNGNMAVYNEGQYLQLTCRVNGPENLRMVWTQKSDFGLSFAEYPIANDITPQTSNPALGGSCNEYIHETMLSLNLTQFNNDGYTYRCEVRPTQTGSTVMSRNITLGITSIRTTPAPGPATGGSSDPDPGMIAGIVVGIVALIIIVIIVVVVVMKKKKSKGDKYADNQPDDRSHEPDLHAPPPVFYSKPVKPPKDERDSTIPPGMTNEGLDTSYDSKDSANRGPPRYANTDPEINGPPRYEKESHRGRHNRGYNEEDADRNGGHGRRYPPSRDDRRSRSRDVDDEPRARHYSTEDGTDDRDRGYGDPSIGTAI